MLILRRLGEDTFMASIEELPSGGVEPGENLLTALGRELAEEIGRTGPLSLDPGFVTHFDYISGSGRKARQYTFGLAHHGRPIVLSTEHTAHRWLHTADLADSDVTDRPLKQSGWAAS